MFRHRSFAALAVLLCCYVPTDARPAPDPMDGRNPLDHIRTRRLSTQTDASEAPTFHQYGNHDPHEPAAFSEPQTMRYGGLRANPRRPRRGKRPAQSQPSHLADYGHPDSQYGQVGYFPGQTEQSTFFDPQQAFDQQQTFDQHHHFATPAQRFHGSSQATSSTSQEGSLESVIHGSGAASSSFDHSLHPEYNMYGYDQRQAHFHGSSWQQGPVQAQAGLRRSSLHPLELDFDVSPFHAGPSAHLLANSVFGAHGQEDNAFLDNEKLIWEERKERGYRRKMYEIISKRRGYRHESARRNLKAGLTAFLEAQLLSDDMHIVDVAVAFFFPITRNTQMPIWKTEMKEDDCERFVQKIVEMSSQSHEIIRNYLLTSQLPGEEALKLNNGSVEQLNEYITDNGISDTSNQYYEDGSKRQYAESIGANKWQHGLTTGERTAVVDYIMKAFGASRMRVYIKLKDARIWSGFGKALLNAASDGDEGKVGALLQYYRYGMLKSAAQIAYE
ncbi:hypothetical protein CBS101457_000260 [Exobasidium rhododendri]|nr:hypothetical protein CBS101457_000260 [Exobasidium rhododendri]